MKGPLHTQKKWQISIQWGREKLSLWEGGQSSVDTSYLHTISPFRFEKEPESWNIKVFAWIQAQDGN